MAGRSASLFSRSSMKANNEEENSFTSRLGSFFSRGTNVEPTKIDEKTQDTTEDEDEDDDEEEKEQDEKEEPKKNDRNSRSSLRPKVLSASKKLPRKKQQSPLDTVLLKQEELDCRAQLPSITETGLKFRPANHVDLLYKQEDDFNIWRPRLLDNEVCLGHFCGKLADKARHAVGVLSWDLARELDLQYNTKIFKTLNTSRIRGSLRENQSETNTTAYPVRPPASFQKIWSDSNLQSSKTRISIYRMIPPTGYVALGHVAVTTRELHSAGDIVSNVPYVKRLMCLREDLVTSKFIPNQFEKIWEDPVSFAGMGQANFNQRVSFWKQDCTFNLGLFLISPTHYVNDISSENPVVVNRGFRMLPSNFIVLPKA